MPAAKFCQECGSALDNAPTAENYLGIGGGKPVGGDVPTSSGGRRPDHGVAAQAARQRWLAAWDNRHAGAPAGDSFIERLGRAERLVEICEDDWSNAVAGLRCAQSEMPGAELAHGRHLDPAARSRFVALSEAQTTEQRCAEAYRNARSNLNRMLETWEQISRPDLGRMPVSDGDDDGLSRIDRSRHF